MTYLPTVLFGLALSLANAGCNKTSSVSSAQTAATKATPPAAAVLTAAKVSKIVFVGKEHACDCTRKTVDAGWEALQTVLGTPAKLPVERMQIDTESAKVEAYRRQKPIMALPGIYFVDDKNAVVELLQGEVKAEEIAKVLASR